MNDNPITLTAAFLIGLVSTVHCVGMCGSIMGALSLSLPAGVRDNRLLRFGFVTSYNLGRILSYSLGGLLAGSIGVGLLGSSGLQSAHAALQGIGVVMMVLIGLYLAGWLPQLAYFENIGAPVWRRLEPVGRRMMPVNTPLKAFAYGGIWGWLPCGLVYTVLTLTLTAGGAVNGALIMLAFGVGTLPTLIAAGVMTSWLTHFTQSPTTRRLVGVLIILMAVGTLIIPMGGEHHHHLHH